MLELFETFSTTLSYFVVQFSTEDNKKAVSVDTYQKKKKLTVKLKAQFHFKSQV